MMLTWLERGFYEFAGVLLTPVLLLISLSLLYSIYALGCFLMESWQRYRKQPVAQWMLRLSTDSEVLELAIMKRLEWLRIVSRTAPLLGLVATLIPMGPALFALSSSDAQGVAANLVLAFSAVTVALVSASLSFFILTVRRRWLLEDLKCIEQHQGV